MCIGCSKLILKMENTLVGDETAARKQSRSVMGQGLPREPECPSTDSINDVYGVMCAHAVLEIKPRALCRLDNCSTPELHSQHLIAHFHL